MAKQKIRFIDSQSKTLFYVDDGGEVEVFIDGVWKRLACRYIGEYHAEIGGYIYHICEFAEMRKRLNQPYRPVETQKA